MKKMKMDSKTIFYMSLVVILIALVFIYPYISETAQYIKPVNSIYPPVVPPQDAVKIETPESKLYLYEPLDSVKPTITGNEFSILADGAYMTADGMSYPYNQKITLRPDQKIVYERPVTSDKPYLALKLPATRSTYLYEFTFDAPVGLSTITNTSELQAKLQGTSMNILGKDFVVTDATYGSASQVISDFTIMTGLTNIIIQSGYDKKITFNDHVYYVQLLGVAEEIIGDITTYTAVLNINGESFELQAGQTYTLSNGVAIGAIKLVQGKTGEADYAKIAFEAKKIKIVNNGAVVKNNVVQPELFSLIVYNQYAGWSQFMVEYIPTSDIWLLSGDRLVDPFVNAFGLQFVSATKSFDIIVSSGSEQTALIDGKEYLVHLDTLTEETRGGLKYYVASGNINGESFTLEPGEYLAMSDGYTLHCTDTESYTTGEVATFNIFGLASGKIISVLPSGYDMIISYIDKNNNNKNLNVIHYNSTSSKWIWASVLDLGYPTYYDNNIRDFATNETFRISAIEQDYFVVSRDDYSNIVQFISFIPSTSELIFSDETGNQITSINTTARFGSFIVDEQQFIYQIVDPVKKIIKVDLNGDGVIQDSLYTAYTYIVAKNGMKIQLIEFNNRELVSYLRPLISFVEPNKEEGTSDYIRYKIDWNSIFSHGFVNFSSTTDVNYQELLVLGTTGEYRGMTTYGTSFITYSASLGGSLIVNYPDSQTRANVYLKKYLDPIAIVEEYQSICGDGYCDSNVETNANCPADCSIQTLTCTDSDEGLDYYVKGIMTGISSDGTNYTKIDYCADAYTLKEYSCNDDIPNNDVSYNCTNSCSDGACLPEEETCVIVLSEKSRTPGNSVVGDTVTLEWTPCAGANVYTIEYRGGAFGPNWHFLANKTTIFTVDVSAPEDLEYRVTATGPDLLLQSNILTVIGYLPDKLSPTPGTETEAAQTETSAVPTSTEKSTLWSRIINFFRRLFA